MQKINKLLLKLPLTQSNIIYIKKSNQPQICNNKVRIYTSKNDKIKHLKSFQIKIYFKNKQVICKINLIKHYKM